MKKCMIILREDVREESGNVLLKKLATVWTQFFTSILPTLQAIFVTVEHQMSVRTITLLSFRDVVVLKTPNIAGVLYKSSVSFACHVCVIMQKCIFHSPI